MLSRPRRKSPRYRSYNSFQSSPWPNSRIDASFQEQKKEIEEFSKNHY